jgi:hypothetical protein
MTNVSVRLPTVLVLVAVASAASFAAGRSMPASSPAVANAGPAPPPATPMAVDPPEDLPPGHPPTGGGGAMAPSDLPAGHPAVDPSDPAGALADPDTPQSSLAWKAPARWQSVPNASTMRLATYRIPRATGDAEDAELSIMQAGGSVDQNAERWIGQFDAAGQKTAKRATRKVGGLEVTTVEVQGTYSGGMGKTPAAAAGWALLGAIVSTPGSPHFFKLTGPAKSVLAARAEFDAMIDSVAPR